MFFRRPNGFLAAAEGGAMSVYRILTLAVASALGLHATIIGTPQAAFRHLYTLNPTGTVEVQNVYGDVSIMAWDRDEVLVEAVKKSSDPRHLDDARIVVDSSYDSFSIRTLYAGDGTGDLASVEYRIMVPRNANLQNVKLINGGLSIRGLAGAVKASAVNGGIRAETTGRRSGAFDRQRAAGCRFRAHQRRGDDLAYLGERPHPALPAAGSDCQPYSGQSERRH